MCGYWLWMLLGQSIPVTISRSIPLVFDAVTESQSIDAPETITVYLQGTRKTVYDLDHQSLALHIDARTLKDGKNSLPVTPDMLFLPYHIHMVHYKPLPIIITVTNA